jgi:hypothetical protein
MSWTRQKSGRPEAHDLDMNTQDLSSAYGDTERTMSRPALIGTFVYSLTIGWMIVLARYVLLYGTSPQHVARYGHESQSTWFEGAGWDHALAFRSWHAPIGGIECCPGVVSRGRSVIEAEHELSHAARGLIQVRSPRMQQKITQIKEPRKRRKPPPLETPKHPELAGLYKRLPYATAVLREAQKSAIEKPSEKASQRVAELEQMLQTIIARINQIID